MATTTTPYELTEEHRAQMEPWAKTWIANALSTKPMDDEDRVAMRAAITGLYEAANLTPPPPERIVFVPSPFVARLAAGFAAAIWHQRGQGRTTAKQATEQATEQATWQPDEGDRWYVGMQGVRQMAEALVPDNPDLAVQCTAQASRMWDGGNQWSGYPAWLSFFRHVVKLDIDYSKWQHYEAAAIHGGHRVMHEQFCIVSDRPRVLTVDDQSRPHHDSGPFCRWADGTALYAWHGVYVPWWVIEQPSRITLDRVQSEANAEVRRAMIERKGWDWYLDALGAQPVAIDRFGALYHTTMDDALIGVVVVTNSTPEADGTYKRYALLVPPGHQTPHAAVAATFEMTPEEYNPMVES